MEGTVSFKLITVSIVFILLSDAIGPGVYCCPSVCVCYVDESGLRTANCSGVKFMAERKFNKLFHEIEVLNLRMNNDEEPIKLQDDMFTSFAKLKLLNLDKCRINFLPKNVFKGLKKIYEINLSSNDIRHFDNSVFENIYTLYKLNLRGNRLQGSSKPFISSSSLRELDLGYCGMTVLQNEFFHGVKRLTRLFLDGNHLQTVKEHVLPRGITHLNLANNRIINVPVNTIYSLNQLRWLDLSANPINCTCSLLNLQDILSGHAVVIDGDLRCAYPQELENISLYKVNENEVCNKEAFSSRYHFKTSKSQTSKYASYQKKGDYFDNEKYNPFEIQGDDPGTSTDDYYVYEDHLSSDEHVEKVNDNTKNLSKNENSNDGVPVPNAEINTTNKSLNAIEHKIEAENLIADKSNELNENPKTNEQYSFPEDEAKDVNAGNVDEKQLEVKDGPTEPIGANADENNNTDSGNGVKKDDSKPEGDVTVTPVNENKIEKVHDGDTLGKAAGGNEANEKEATPLPLTTLEDVDMNIPPDINDEKHDSDAFDENMKNDHLIPVGEIPHNEITAADNDNLDSKIGTDNNNDNHTEDNVDYEAHIKDINEDNAAVDAENSAITQSIHVNESNVIENDDKSGKDTILKSDMTYPEVEGSGDSSEEIHLGNQSIPIVNEDDIPEHFLTESTQQPTEEPAHKADIYPVHSPDKPEDKHSETEHTGQVVDKQPMNYAELGPYIVVGCIIIFITILIAIALYRGLCKPKETNRKPVPDVEASNGTELQDLTSSLLPKSPVNGEKHNSKYPNEIPSPETVNLIKADKIDEANETNGPNNVHDLNQNDNKNEPVVKNGKPAEGSPPPVEITKARLTVLLESIPRTPIFVQKRPTTINNG